VYAYGSGRLGLPSIGTESRLARSQPGVALHDLPPRCIPPSPSAGLAETGVKASDAEKGQAQPKADPHAPGPHQAEEEKWTEVPPYYDPNPDV
jgi:hypothetical protein